MKHLLLLIAAALLVPTASAQWVFDSNFPDGDDSNTPHIHGLGVTPDGNVWVQSYYPFTGDSVAVDPFPTGDSNDCNAATGMCRVVSLRVYQPDGSQASFSPLTTVTLPGGEQDTLGGGVFRNAEGNLDWAYDTGRGVTVGADGNVYAVFFRTVYKMSADGTVLDVMTPTEIDNGDPQRGLTGPGVDNEGAVYLTGVFPGDPVAKYNSSLDYVENLTDESAGFNRTIFAFPDGNTVIVPNYSAFVSTIYTRPDDLTPYSATGMAFEGMSVESITMHPTSGKIWASAGASASGPPTGGWEDEDGNTGSYVSDTWYEFSVDEVLNNTSPVPTDSIKWNNPDGVGKPRGIAFSPDGTVAYVAQFDTGAPALQKFTFAGTSVANGPQIEGVTLHQNMPNPFHGSTDITFELDDPADVRVAVYDVTGREVALLAAGPRASGSHTVTFSAGDLAGGVYVFALEVDGQRTSRRMLHMR